MEMRNVFMCNCGTGFTLEESATIYEDGLPVTACPHCGSADIEEGDQCEICRHIDYPWNMKHGVCKYCFQAAVSSYKHLLNDSIQPWEREVLEVEYGNLDVTEE